MYKKNGRNKLLKNVLNVYISSCSNQMMRYKYNNCLRLLPLALPIYSQELCDKKCWNHEIL